jgi:hypothetical protein
MTKKDYEAFAAMIRDNTLIQRPDNERDVGYNFALEDMAHDMVRIFEADNERFNKKLFLEACGL